ncbi:MAG: Fe-S cluster protein [Desulfobulbaceae bacterium]|nr:Fe-S cluster protein [Desulfobulbaceae bacterium]
MLLRSFQKEIFRAECRPEAQTVQCIARLGQNIGDVIPYLNAVLGGFSFTREPVSVTFRSQGKLISVHADHIAINALRDAEEADKILCWLQREINDAWEKRHAITPSFQAAPRPQPFAILKFLPKTNCGKCGFSTCLVFVSHMMDGGKGADDCPEMEADKRSDLRAYLNRFSCDF